MELRGIFESGGHKTNAFTFGVSREHFNKVYIEGTTKVDPAVPGPGRYKVPNVMGREGQIVTIKGKN